jgi:M6 family metalloprotease-like protein
VLPALLACIGVAVRCSLPATAQVPDGIYIEPAARAAGVRLPVDVLRTLPAGAPQLGIPDAASFLAGTARSVREGQLRLLVIPALFSDSEEPVVAGDELQRLLFDGPSAQGTIGQFYREASQGRFDVQGTVLPWVRTDVTILEAAGVQEGHGWIGPRMRDYVGDAIRQADATLDFGQFDNDGPDGVPNSGDDNGYIDGLVILSSEVAGSCGGPAPWPHFGGASLGGQYVEVDDLSPAGQRLRVQVYIADSAVDCAGTEPKGIEVLAHETGHLIGLPDLYAAALGVEREQRAWTVGCFDLMAGGAWGCGTGPKVVRFGPTFLSPLMKWQLGWIDWVDVEVADNEEFVLTPSQTSPTALRIRLAPNSLEYFIIEYRPADSFDAALPGSGVLIYHHDTFPIIRPVSPGEPRAFRYHLVEADGDNGLRRAELQGGNRGVAGDIFARNGAVDSIDNTSTPSTREHAGGASTLTIHSVLVDGDNARVRLSVGTGMQITDRQLPDSVPALAQVTGSVAVSGGVAPYTATLVAGGLPHGVTASFNGGQINVNGQPRWVGYFAASYAIEDANGQVVTETIGLRVHDMQIDEGLLVRSLNGSPGIDQQTRDYLDSSANGNGRFDVGDLRAYLLRTGRLR